MTFNMSHDDVVNENNILFHEMGMVFD